MVNVYLSTILMSHLEMIRAQVSKAILMRIGQNVCMLIIPCILGNKRVIDASSSVLVYILLRVDAAYRVFKSV